MDWQHRAYESFLAYNTRKACCTEEPVVHLHFHGKQTLHDPLLQLTREDVLDALNPESVPVRWLLEQMRTYDPCRQVIVCLVFDENTVISDTFWEVDPARVQAA